MDFGNLFTQANEQKFGLDELSLRRFAVLQEEIQVTDMTFSVILLH